VKLPNYLTKAHKQSRKLGWTWEMRTRHIEVRDANGDFVVSVSTTAYDGSLTRKVKGTLRKAGCPGV
jgi:hypothetical protein